MRDNILDRHRNRYRMRANLCRLYKSATPADIAAGSAWYPSARRIIAEWSVSYGFTIPTTACVVAALSPQCDWARNLVIADDMLAGRPPSIGALRSNVDKAAAILRDCATSVDGYFKSAPKVNAFARNLAGCNETVTVDTHALQAALFDVKVTLGLKAAYYGVFSQAYQDAARACGLQPAEFQAIIWHTWKRRYPPERKRQHRRQWDAMGEF